MYVGREGGWSYLPSFKGEWQVVVDGLQRVVWRLKCVVGLGGKHVGEDWRREAFVPKHR